MAEKILGMIPVMQSILNALHSTKDVVSLSGVCRASRGAIFLLGGGPPPLRGDICLQQRRVCCSRQLRINPTLRANIDMFTMCDVACCSPDCEKRVQDASSGYLMDALCLLRNRGSGGIFAPSVTEICLRDLVLVSDQNSLDRAEVEKGVRWCINRFMEHDKENWRWFYF